MNECLYTKKLAWFKQNERPESVLVVADNPEAIRVVIAWTNLKVQRPEKLTELRADSENEVWEWLWMNTRYSKTELMEKSGLSISESGLDSKMKPLIGNRVIYPDSTINSFVQRYLRERVLKLFEAKSRLPAKNQ